MPKKKWESMLSVLMVFRGRKATRNTETALPLLKTRKGKGRLFSCCWGFRGRRISKNTEPTLPFPFLLCLRPEGFNSVSGTAKWKVRLFSVFILRSPRPNRILNTILNYSSLPFFGFQDIVFSSFSVVFETGRLENTETYSALSCLRLSRPKGFNSVLGAAKKGKGSVFSMFCETERL